MAKEYTVAWMYHYFPIKDLPSIWRANTNLSTYNTTMSSCRHTSFTHVQISLTHLLPAIYMTKKRNSVKATVISDGAPVILLRKSQNISALPVDISPEGMSFVIVSSSLSVASELVLRHTNESLPGREEILEKTTFVTTVWERRWPPSNYLLTHRDSYLA